MCYSLFILELKLFRDEEYAYLKIYCLQHFIMVHRTFEVMLQSN